MGMYTGLWTRLHLHPKIHPGLGTGVPLLPRAPRLLAALPRPGGAGGQARHAMKGLKAAPAAPPAAKALPPLRQRWDGLQPAEPLLGPGISCHTTGLRCVCLLGQRGKMR